MGISHRRTVHFIDTSVFLELLNVPGFADHPDLHQEQLISWTEQQHSFILPITTIIETGNHISQIKGNDRRGPAERFVDALQKARASQPPWMIRDVRWDSEFLESFVAGGPSGSDLLTHLTNQTLGSGDVAILVERQQFLSEVNADVHIWTLDQKLQAIAN